MTASVLPANINQIPILWKATVEGETGFGMSTPMDAPGMTGANEVLAKAARTRFTAPEQLRVL